ncbi:hypothetical protein GWI33_005380 [Rhynchophorus ferrugineus]|uniref:Uncharacterized protein n=1 Tax=Rhynchophorus ferrugineus TaxID=354439 RepID=A0A834IHK8_RHYFE|nr:hypothetical protein GWI33_005380 [Rhynchophorus ferrugineus]
MEFLEPTRTGGEISQTKSIKSLAIGTPADGARRGRHGCRGGACGPSSCLFAVVFAGDAWPISARRYKQDGPAVYRHIYDILTCQKYETIKIRLWFERSPWSGRLGEVEEGLSIMLAVQHSFTPHISSGTLRAARVAACSEFNVDGDEVEEVDTVVGEARRALSDTDREKTEYFIEVKNSKLFAFSLRTFLQFLPLTPITTATIPARPPTSLQYGGLKSVSNRSTQKSHHAGVEFVKYVAGNDDEKAAKVPTAAAINHGVANCRREMAPRFTTSRSVSIMLSVRVGIGEELMRKMNFKRWILRF